MNIEPENLHTFQCRSQAELGKHISELNIVMKKVAEKTAVHTVCSVWFFRESCSFWHK